MDLGRRGRVYRYLEHPVGGNLSQVQPFPGLTGVLAAEQRARILGALWSATAAGAAGGQARTGARAGAGAPSQRAQAASQAGASATQF